MSVWDSFLVTLFQLIKFRSIILKYTATVPVPFHPRLAVPVVLN